MKIKVFTLNAFAKTKNGGNPAGVVLASSDLNDKQMLDVAKKIGFSETAFVQQSEKADFRVRFFTVTGEVPLCGHATIATFFLLANQNIISPGKYTQETKAGILPIEILSDGKVFMNQNLPQYFDIIDKEIIAESLNIPPDIICDDLPIQIVSTGLKDTFIPIRTLDELLNIKPNLEVIKEMSRKFGVIGYHVFSLETKFNAIAHSRNFGPLHDISEEAATGTSTGALSCYLFKHGKINQKQIGNLVFEQGYSMKRPSEITAEIRIEGNDIVGIRVGGTATNIQQIEVEI